MNNRILLVSPHTIALAADCRTRLLLRLANMWDAGEPPSSPTLSMTGGNWGHQGLAAWIEGKDWKEVMKPYEGISDDGGFADDRRGYKNMDAVLSAVFGRLHRDRLPFTILEGKTTEVTFTAPLGTIPGRQRKDPSVDVVLIGVIDALVKDKKTQHKMALEHKFTGRLDATFIASFMEYDVQTTSYIYAADLTQGTFGGECIVNAIEMSMVPSSNRTCPKHGVLYSECGPEHVKQTFFTVTRTPAQMAEFKRDALRLVRDHVLPVALYLEKHGSEGAARTPRDGKFTSACDFCEFRKWCLGTNRSLAVMHTMLKPNLVDSRRIRSGLLSIEEGEKLYDQVKGASRQE